MGKISWKLRHYSNGIYLSVIILLFFQTFAGGQRFNRRRAGFHRRGYVDYQARNQYRPEQAIGRDRTSRRHDNVNTVNNRIQRLGYLRQQRAQLETKIDRHNAQLRQEMYRGTGRGSTAHDSRTVTGRDSGLQNFRTGNSANGDILGRHNYIRHANSDIIDYNNQRTAGAQTHRTAVVKTRRRNNYVRPRGRTSIVENNRDTVENGGKITGYSPLLSRRIVSPHQSPLVQTTEYTRRNSLRHFKPFSSNYLRQLSAKSDRVGNRKYYPFAHSSSSGHVTTRRVRPTRQSFPDRPIVYQTRGRGNTMQGRNTIVNSLDAPVQRLPVEPTKDTPVRRLENGQSSRNLQKVLIPFPSVVPEHGTSNGPVKVLRRTELPNGDTILKVVPVRRIVVPAVTNIKTGPRAVQTEQNVVPVQHVGRQQRISTQNSPNNILEPKAVNANLLGSKVVQHFPTTSDLVQSNLLGPGAIQTSVVLPGTNHIPNTVQSANLHVPNTVQSNVQTIQSNVQLPNTVQSNEHLQNTVQSNVHPVQSNVPVLNTVQSNGHVPNTVLSNVHVPSTVLSNVHVPNTVQSNINAPQNVQTANMQVPNKIQSNVHVPSTVMSNIHPPHTDQSANAHVPNTVQSNVHVPNTVQSNVHVPNAVQSNVNTLQSNVPIQNTVQSSLHLQNTVPSNVHTGQSNLQAPNTIQSNVHTVQSSLPVPNTVQSNLQVPNTVQANLLVPNTVQSNLQVPNTVQSNLQVPNTVQSNLQVPNMAQSMVPLANTASYFHPGNSWLSQMFLNREQPDSPDPTEVVKTVTELVSLLSSVVPDVAATGEEEEEIEWEDLPPPTTTTTTTTTTTPLPPTEAPTTPKNVIKSIAERIVSLLVQRSGRKRIPKVNNKQQISKTNAKNTLVSATPILPVQPLQTHKKNPIGALRDKLLPEVQPTFPALRPSVINPVIGTNLPLSATEIALSRLVSHPTIRSILQNQMLAQDLSHTASSGQLNLNDVILSDSLPHTGTNPLVEGIALAPYMSSNDLGGLSVKKIVPITNESVTKGNKTSPANVEQNQGKSGDIAVQALLEKIKAIVSIQNAPTKTETTTTTTAAPVTLAPTTPTPIMLTPAPTFASVPDTCRPGSPNFQCKGKDMFQAMETIGAWCIGMCFKRGCISTVCTCGCNLPPTQMSPSAIPLNPTQRRQILNSFDSSRWGRTTQNPVTTEEPPEEEEEEWEAEDGTTTMAPTTTLNPWWAVPWDGKSPSPQSDFRLNPIDQHSSDAKKIGQHVSELNEIAWASEIKSRLNQLAVNADNSTNADTFVAEQTGTKAPPNWQGTEFHLQTPPPKKPPPTPESNAARSNTWQRRPLRDKWGRSERFTGGGESQSGSNPGWNMWNNPWQMNSFGNRFGGDSRLSRFRFNWGGGSGGSGGEENEAAD